MHTTTWVKTLCRMEEDRKRDKYCIFHLFGASRIGKFRETKSSPCQGLRGEEMGSWYLMGTEFLFELTRKF